MSLVKVRDVFAGTFGRPARKLVALVLADSAAIDGKCWMSVKTLADRTELSDRAVQHALRDLVAQDVIRLDVREGAPDRPNCYVWLSLFRGGFSPERLSPQIALKG